MIEASGKAATDVCHRHIVPTFLHALMDTCDGDGGIGQPKVVQIDLEAPSLCIPQQSQVGLSAQGTLYREGFPLRHKPAELFEQQPSSLDGGSGGIER